MRLWFDIQGQISYTPFIKKRVLIKETNTSLLTALLKDEKGIEVRIRDMK